jgi:hypothetical protein
LPSQGKAGTGGRIDHRRENFSPGAIAAAIAAAPGCVYYSTTAISDIEKRPLAITNMMISSVMSPMID